jgi:hypothetical protein
MNTGDANCDGVTNIIDYGLWASEYLDFSSNRLSSRTTWLSDFNCDQKIDRADYDVWVNKWQR